MSESTVGLKRKISSASDLLAVVRTMKAMTASNINQYERAVGSLDDYYRTVKLGLAVCFKRSGNSANLHSELLTTENKPKKIGVLAFGSDQGLVGQFNDSLAEFVLADLTTQKRDAIVWVAGERLQSRLEQSDLELKTGFALPRSIKAITPLIGEILLTMETFRTEGKISEVTVFHNKPDHSHTQSSAIYAPVKQHLLPLDAQWQHQLMETPWPTKNLPEVVDAAEFYDQEEGRHKSYHETQLALIHEYLFVSLYRTCAESLASENASRLAAMQRAEKNIDELLLKMNSQFHSLRQSGIDEELFDVISGFNALTYD